MKLNESKRMRYSWIGCSIGNIISRKIIILAELRFRSRTPRLLRRLRILRAQPSANVYSIAPKAVCWTVCKRRRIREGEIESRLNIYTFTSRMERRVFMGKRSCYNISEIGKAFAYHLFILLPPPLSSPPLHSGTYLLLGKMLQQIVVVDANKFVRKVSFRMGSGFGSVGRAVASNSSGLWFESSHRRIFK